jgi:hypothetical protein
VRPWREVLEALCDIASLCVSLLHPARAMSMQVAVRGPWGEGAGMAVDSSFLYKYTKVEMQGAIK